MMPEVCGSVGRYINVKLIIERRSSLLPPALEKEEKKTNKRKKVKFGLAGNTTPDRLEVMGFETNQ